MSVIFFSTFFLLRNNNLSNYEQSIIYENHQSLFRLITYHSMTEIIYELVKGHVRILLAQKEFCIINK